MAHLVVLLAELPPEKTLLKRFSKFERFDVERVGHYLRIDIESSGTHLSLDVGAIRDYEPDELKSFADRVGSQPRAMVSIHYGADTASFVLADSVAREICHSWHGTVDYDP